MLRLGDPHPRPLPAGGGERACMRSERGAFQKICAIVCQRGRSLSWYTAGRNSKPHSHRGAPEPKPAEIALKADP
jgi:hypothetical protein